MHVIYTKDTQSNTYVNALAIRKEVFIKEQGVPVEREIDENEQQAIHFVLYNDQNEPLATVRLLPSGNNIVKVQRMAVEKKLEIVIMEKLLCKKQKTMQVIMIIKK